MRENIMGKRFDGIILETKLESDELRGRTDGQG